MFSHSHKTQWQRKGNFWQVRKRSVNFMSDGVIAPRLSFDQVDGAIQVTLLVSEFYLPKIKNYFVQGLSGTIGLRFEPNAIGFELEADTAAKLITIFKKINSAYQCHEFSESLLKEIKQIGNYRSGLLISAEHTIKEYDTVHNWLINPACSTSLRLVRLFKKSSPKNPLAVKQIKECFKDGENPNQCDETSNTPMDILFTREDLSEQEFKWGVSWLLAFKWVTERASWGEFSTLEKRARFHLEKMHWFGQVIGLQINKPVPTNTMKVQSCGTPDKILTSITTGNKNIRTIIKNTTKLKHEEYDSLYALFAATFEVDPNKRDQLCLEDVFQEDVVGHNKHIEIIYANECIIGFNLYEVMTLDDYPDHLVLHCVDSVIHPDYRRSGLITMLVFRIALLLQMLYPEKIVSLFCVAIHANSGTLFNNLNMLYHPQYGGHDEFVRAILGKKIPYFRDNVECHIPQRVKVRESGQIFATEHFLKAFFKNEMLGGDKDNECKGVPMVLFMGYQTYDQVCDFYVRDFNFGAHLRDFAAEILRARYQFHSAEMSKEKQVALRDVTQLFWCNENVATHHVLTFRSRQENRRCGL